MLINFHAKKFKVKNYVTLVGMERWHFWNVPNSLAGADGVSIKVVSFSPQQEQAPRGREGQRSI